MAENDDIKDELLEVREENAGLKTDNDMLRLSADKDAKIATLARQLVRLTERVPENLNSSIISFGLKIDQLVKDVEKMSKDMKSDFVSRTEFEVLKVEHEMMKKLMWGGVGLVLTLILTAIIGLVIIKSAGTIPIVK